MIPYCEKHQIRMLPSKFREGEFWCPQCSAERKQSQGFQPVVSQQKIEALEILKRIEEKIDKLLEGTVIYPPNAQKKFEQRKQKEELEEELEKEL